STPVAAGGYRPAAVCRRGHMITATADSGSGISTFCPRCGSEVLTACESCGFRIKGRRIGMSGAPYTPPDFCDNCSAPFPWLSREGLVFQLQNLLDGEELDEATRLEIREQLEALAERDISLEEQLSRWER